MKERIKPLLDRRSIRSYLDKQITEEELDTVLEAGKYAPSGMNNQLWKFVVIQGNIMNDFIESLKDDWGLKHPFYGAPTLIIVFVDKDAHTPVQDGSIAIGNMLNAAHMVGLGSCWINSVASYFNTDNGRIFQNRLDVPSNYVSVGSCVLGYIEGDIPAPKPRKENTVIIAK